MAKRDIVDLLREGCARIECDGTCNSCPYRDAAAEIERLRAIIAESGSLEFPAGETGELHGIGYYLWLDMCEQVQRDIHDQNRRDPRHLRMWLDHHAKVANATGPGVGTASDQESE